MKFELVIFDLDGTLLDTLGDLAAACNEVLERRGLPQHSYEDYAHFVGNGIMRLVERALPESWRTPERLRDARADFIARYTDRIDRLTRPYPGIEALLHRLADGGVRLAVASNKFQAGTEKLVRSYFPDIPFAVVLGQRPDVPLKPDPAVVREVLRRTGVPQARALMAGDSGVDIATAAAAGIRSVGVTWGFRDCAELREAGAGWIVRSPDEIARIVAGGVQ